MKDRNKDREYQVKDRRDDVDHRRPKVDRKARRHDANQLLRAGRYEELYDEE